ncbi:uncharacterized protein C8R40DRAFT_1170141 [Lentinula edodes]|uniref:uncharacterized protein n=1 Tax=Lentinula edodes TaxID=5353 RepID=UPI001E8CCF78|nr:uncharacterized protein C8R40DRAFT_1170141 [Lentinula edodes]KAH7875552.1 hypothetical protein C8R40DRAFT_1170141 [Lentinula edodes]
MRLCSLSFTLAVGHLVAVLAAPLDPHGSHLDARFRNDPAPNPGAPARIEEYEPAFIHFPWGIQGQEDVPDHVQRRVIRKLNNLKLEDSSLPLPVTSTLGNIRFVHNWQEGLAVDAAFSFGWWNQHSRLLNWESLSAGSAA